MKVIFDKIYFEIMKKRRRFTIEKREQARKFVAERINYFNGFYNFRINRIAIKNTKTRWGSCSEFRNLNFNYKIIYLKPQLADYLIVHELCHLGELNHSKRYWNLVKKTIPGYVAINKELRKTPVNLV